MPDPARVESIFHEALALGEHQRAAYVRREAAGDEALVAEVLALLAHDAGSSDGAILAMPVTLGPVPGDRVGPYELVELVAEGGFGSVYRARQDHPVRREVALKLVKPGMDTRRVVQRFETERQALASMDHPHIARALDAGATEAGRPYFAMEFVPGQPVTRYCDDRGLSIDERLGVFRQVCAAVEHAHQKAVLHRDIKPSNVLVHTVDGGPFVKVIDFGIAKAIADDAPSSVTFEGLPIGTPAYMSPEQALGDWSRVDTRSDVYALGILLYELLTGQLPVEPTTVTTPEALRRALDAPTVRPSSRARTAEVAQARATDPAALSRRLRGDLDWIVLKALERDPARRYPSVSALADDIERNLKDLPVSAAAPTLRYRAGKYVRRHRVGVGVAAVVSAVVVLGMIGTGVGFARALDAEREARRLAEDEAAARVLAEQRFEQVRGLAGTLIHDIRDAVANVPGGTEAQRLIVDTGLEYLNNLGPDAAGDPDLLLEVAMGYMRLGNVLGNPGMQNMGDTAGAMACYRSAAEVILTIPDASSNAGAQLALAWAHRGIASLHLAMGETAQAAEEMERAIGVARRGIELDPRPELVQQEAFSRASLARMHESMGRLEEAVADYRAFGDFLEAKIEDNPDDLLSRRNRAMLLSRVAALRIRLGQTDGALDALRRADEAVTELLAVEPDNMLFLTAQQAIDQERMDCLHRLERPGEALETAERFHATASRIATADPADQQAQRSLAIASFWRGTLLLALDRPGEAIDHLESYQRQLDALIERAPDYAVLRRDRLSASTRLAETLIAVGRHADAARHLDDAISRVDALAAENPQDSSLRLERATQRADAARLLVAWGESASQDPAPWAAARARLLEALDIHERLSADGNPPPPDAAGKLRADLAACEAALARLGGSG